MNSTVWTIVGVLAILALLVWLFSALGDNETAGLITYLR